MFVLRLSQRPCIKAERASYFLFNFPFLDVFDDFDWIRNCGPTPSETTGPENDHTRGNFRQDVPNAACSGAIPHVELV